MPVNFPYDYGDELTVEEAKTNLNNQAKDILSVLPVLILTLGSSAVAADGSSANDGLKSQWKTKQQNNHQLSDYPNQHLKRDVLSTRDFFVRVLGLFVKMQSGNPALILGCAAVTFGFMFPDMLKYLKK